MADAPDLGSGSRKAVGVRLPPFAFSIIFDYTDARTSTDYTDYTDFSLIWLNVWVEWAHGRSATQIWILPAGVARQRSISDPAARQTFEPALRKALRHDQQEKK